VCDLSELKITQHGRESQRPTPTDEQVQRFTRTFGVELPDDHLALLRHANGGHPELDSFVPEGAEPNDTWSVAHFYHLSDNEGSESLWQAARDWQPYLGNRSIPLGEDGGGNQIFMDTRTVPPSVKLAVFEGAVSIKPVAPSLSDFLALLHVDPDFI